MSFESDLLFAAQVKKKATTPEQSTEAELRRKIDALKEAAKSATTEEELDALKAEMDELIRQYRGDAAPEKKKSSLFDPERDMKDEDWEGMERKLGSLRVSGWASFTDMASCMYTLDPQKTEKLITDADWEEMAGRLEEARRTKWDDFAVLARAMHVLDPEKTQKFIKKNDWKGMTETLEGVRREKDCRYFAYMVSCMHTLDPEKTQNLIKKTDWEGMREKLEELRGRNWSDFAHMASSMHTLAQL